MRKSSAFSIGSANIRVAVTLNFVIHRPQHPIKLEEMLALAELFRARLASNLRTSSITAGPLPIVENLLRRACSWINRSRSSSANRNGSGQDSRRIRRLRYYAKYPKPCMGGWGRQADGDYGERRCASLPCRASQFPASAFENVKDRSLREIWEHSAAFQKFAAKPGCRSLAKPATAAELGFRAAAAARHCFSRECRRH